MQKSGGIWNAKKGGIWNAKNSGIWNAKKVVFEMQKKVAFEMQKKSPSEPRRDKSDDTAAHHAADAEDGDDEGPDEGDRGVARRVQRLPFLQGLTPQLWKEKVFFTGMCL